MKRAAWHLHRGVRSGPGLTAGERAADVLKARFGSWPFLFILNAIFVTEVCIHVVTHGKFDPGLLYLNLFLSWLAAQQGGALQIASNRGDRISAEVALHTQGNTDELMTINRQQLQVLTKLDGLDGKVADLAEAVQVVMAARAKHDSAVQADAKAARTAAESAFVATQALAAVAVKPAEVSMPAPPEAKPAKGTKGG